MMATYDDNLMRAYLLGGLPEAETEACDELSFTDEAFIARLQSVEDDLVDAYLQNELTGKELDQFQTYYLASPRRQEKVRFASSLQTFAAQEVMTVVPTVEDLPVVSVREPELGSFWQSLRSFFALPSLQFGMAAAMVLLLLGSGWLFLEMQRLRGQIGATQTERASLEQRERDLRTQIEQQRATNAQTVEQLNEELKRTQQQLEQLKQKQELAAQQAKVEPPAGEVIQSELLPQTRAMGNATTLTIPAKASSVLLQLVSPADDFALYQAELIASADAKVLWKSGKVKAQTSGEKRRIALRVRANLLPPGNYQIRLKGIAADGQSEELRKYAFKVVAP